MSDITSLIQTNISEPQIKPLWEFQEFLNEWDASYKVEAEKIDLFNPEKTASLSSEKITYFVKAFYHLRGHFHDFLWYMGNHAPSKHAKQIILENISEEFGESYCSHEQLYFDFAESLGVDMKNEIVEGETNEPYIREFNKGHLRWLNQHEWAGCMAAFSAYEHLDNIDYPLLSSLAKSFKTSERGALFFKVHEKVTHFDSLSDLLIDSWNEHPEKVKEGFNFIKTHQLAMWNNLSEKVFSE